MRQQAAQGSTLASTRNYHGADRIAAAPLGLTSTRPAISDSLKFLVREFTFRILNSLCWRSPSGRVGGRVFETQGFGRSHSLSQNGCDLNHNGGAAVPQAVDLKVNRVGPHKGVAPGPDGGPKGPTLAAEGARTERVGRERHRSHGSPKGECRWPPGNAQRCTYRWHRWLPHGFGPSHEVGYDPTPTPGGSTETNPSPRTHHSYSPPNPSTPRT